MASVFTIWTNVLIYYYYYYYFLTINQKKKKKHQLDHCHRQPQLATIHSNTTTSNHILTHCKTHRQPLGLRSAKLIANPCTTARPPPDLQDDADRNHRETTARPPPDLQDDADHLKPIPTVNPQKSTANPPKIQKKTHCKLNKNPSLWLLPPQPITASPHPSPSSGI